MSTNLASAFRAAVEQHRGKTAIFWADDEITYEKVFLQASEVARRLENQFDLQSGDRVAVWLKNCPEFVPVLFGIFMAGGVAVPINNFLKPAEVSYILNDCGAEIIFSDESLAAGMAALREMHDGLREFNLSDLQHPEPRPLDSGSQPDRRTADLAVIIYTSGTTGHPKGAMLSHGNLLSNVESCRLMLEAGSEDRFVVLLPMFHSFMLCVGVCLPMLLGSSIVLVKSVHPPKNVLAEIIRRQATLLPAIPQFFRMMATAAEVPPLPLRLCVSGAAPLPVEVLKQFNSKYTFPLLEGYGLSEASPVVSMNPIPGPWKAGSIGKPIPNVEVSVQDESGKELSVDEVGEICVRGPNVMLGYWNLPKETAETLQGGWLRTGDIGKRDGDGYFYITDRKKDMLLVNGINVYPREIEELMYQIPGVKEAAVIGVADARKGEQPQAFIALDENAAVTEKEVLQWLRPKLADYKMPRKVTILAALPRNATGKILKRELRDQTKRLE